MHFSLYSCLQESDINKGGLFGFYRGNCFDRVVILLNSRIYVTECPVGIDISLSHSLSLYIYIYITLEICFRSVGIKSRGNEVRETLSLTYLSNNWNIVTLILIFVYKIHILAVAVNYIRVVQ